MTADVGRAAPRRRFAPEDDALKALEAIAGDEPELLRLARESDRLYRESAAAEDRGEAERGKRLHDASCEAERGFFRAPARTRAGLLIKLRWQLDQAIGPRDPDDAGDDLEKAGRDGCLADVERLVRETVEVDTLSLELEKAQAAARLLERAAQDGDDMAAVVYLADQIGALLGRMRAVLDADP